MPINVETHPTGALIEKNVRDRSKSDIPRRYMRKCDTAAACLMPLWRLWHRPDRVLGIGVEPCHSQDSQEAFSDTSNSKMDANAYGRFNSIPSPI
eukprot:777878-Pyramimonas_sp.AAC.1